MSFELIMNILGWLGVCTVIVIFVTAGLFDIVSGRRKWRAYWKAQHAKEIGKKAPATDRG
jgi:hypothetical protein